MNHDHENMEHGSSQEKMCPMIMVFHAGHCETILFNGWVASTVVEFVFSALAIFVLGISYEAIKFLREYLLAKGLKKEAEKAGLPAKSPDAKCSDPPAEAGSCHKLPRLILKEQSYRERVTGKTHLIQTLINIVQLIIAYLLMLIVMTFNYWLCLAVILGIGAGYFIFGCVRSNRIDTECCN